MLQMTHAGAWNWLWVVKFPHFCLGNAELNVHMRPHDNTSINSLLLSQQVSLCPPNLSQLSITDNPLSLLLSPLCSSPLLSFHTHSNPARRLSRDPFSTHPSLPIHQPFHTRYRSEDRVPNPSPIPLHSSILITIFSPLLTSTRSMRWWRNNTDTWSYSICALGPRPKSVVISSPNRSDSAGGGGRGWGVPRVSGHHSAREDFLEGFKNRGLLQEAFAEHSPASLSASSLCEVWCTVQSTHFVL